MTLRFLRENASVPRVFKIFVFSVFDQSEVVNIDFQSAALVFGGEAPHKAGHHGSPFRAGMGGNAPAQEGERRMMPGKEEVDFPDAFAIDQVFDDGSVGQPRIVFYKFHIPLRACVIGQVQIAQALEHGPVHAVAYINMVSHCSG